MTRHGPALLALSVIAVAGWTYNVNYDTRAALERLSKLRAEIGAEREALQVLRVEWAYLNAPDRLAALVARHNEALRLSPLVPEGLGIVAAIPYPPRNAPEVPSEPEALIAAAASSAPLPARARAELAGRAGGSGPAEGALKVEPASWSVAAARSSELQVETVPAALEASIDAALQQVGAPAGQSGVARNGIVSVPATSRSEPFAGGSPGAPLPAARPVAWSGG